MLAGAGAGTAVAATKKGQQLSIPSESLLRVSAGTASGRYRSEGRRSRAAARRFKLQIVSHPTPLNTWINRWRLHCHK